MSFSDDEKRFLDKAMIAIAAGLCADANMSANIPLTAKRLAEGLLDERRELLGQGEQQAPEVYTVDGKTPGEVSYTERRRAWADDGYTAGLPWSDLTPLSRKVESTAAQAVLRAFGNGSAVLRQFRARVLQLPGRKLSDDPERMHKASDIVAAIDNELAKLEGRATCSPAAG